MNNEIDNNTYLQREILKVSEQFKTKELEFKAKEQNHRVGIPQGKFPDGLFHAEQEMRNYHTGF